METLSAAAGMPVDDDLRLPATILVTAHPRGPEIEILVPTDCPRIDIIDVLAEQEKYPYFVDHYMVCGSQGASLAVVLSRTPGRYSPGEPIRATGEVIIVPRGAERLKIMDALLADVDDRNPILIDHGPDSDGRDEALVLVFGATPAAGGLPSRAGMEETP